jgi:hypothetical protein
VKSGLGSIEWIFCFGTKVIIELQGYQTHGQKARFVHDAGRERYLQRQGYRLIRFAGKEVFDDPHRCVNEVVEFVRALPADTSSVAVASSRLPPVPRAVERRVVVTVSGRLWGMQSWQIVILGVLGGLLLVLVTVSMMLLFFPGGV